MYRRVKDTVVFCSLIAIGMSCTEPKEMSSIDPVNWNKRTVGHPLPDSLTSGETYLSVYSEIYSRTEHQTHALTVTVSMRNTDPVDSVFITKAEYFDTQGKPIRIYFEKAIYLAPLETVEIVIDEKDREGGTGGNFLFDWSIPTTASEPYFEGVMISTSGQQGISFTTQGKRVR
ncbi:MAG: DUF3124 domain-containing protein [Cyclobacteriaceae bacterium]|nr:DUF3124 domain-containing protein [Cyclobacteriaceae bacterium]